MPRNDDVAACPAIESLGVHRPDRKVAKLVGAIVFTLVSLVLVGRALWVSRDEWPALLNTDAVLPREAVTSSEGVSPEIADLVARAGLSPGTGRLAAPLSLRGGEGTVGSLEPLRGKVVLIAFWGTTCGPCMVELPELEQLARRYEKSGFVVLPVCTDETNVGKAGDVAARVAPNLTVYVDSDGSARKAYHVRHIPQALLVDREGRVVGRSLGNIRWSGEDVERLLAACLRIPASLTSGEDDAL